MKKNIRIINQSKIKIPEKPDLANMTIRNKIQFSKLYLLKLQKIKQYYDMSSLENLSNCIKTLKNIHKTGNKSSLELEKQASLALMALNDAEEIKPNYPMGDDGEPTFTAPRGVSDIECYYNVFNLVCEVTLLKNRAQWYNEGQSVMRHLREFEEKNPDKTSYCLFIAPKIHIDTTNTFWNAIKYEYRGKPQKIIPFTIDQFIHLLDILHIYRDKYQNVFSHNELIKLYDSIINLVRTSPSSDEWIKQIPNQIKMWEQWILK